MAVLGGEAIVEAVRLIESGEAVFTPQDHSQATHCIKITKAEGQINFANDKNYLRNFVHAMNPLPSAYTFVGGKQLKIVDLLPVDDDTEAECGTVIYADKAHGIVVKCCDGAVRLVRIQLEGKGKTDDVSFLNGNKDIKVGVILA
jgi:methionyl-tRNA formyltransferase